MYKVKRFQNWMKSQHQLANILGEEYLKKANTSLLSFLQIYYDISNNYEFEEEAQKLLEKSDSEKDLKISSIFTHMAEEEKGHIQALKSVYQAFEGF